MRNEIDMKKFNTLLILSALMSLLIGCGSNSGSNQSPDNTRLQSMKDSPAPYPVADAERTKAVDELVEFRKKMLALEGKLIAPAQEDLNQYADFLKDSNAGIARVFPRDSGNERRPLLVNGEGAYYQFKGRTNEYGHGSDLEYSTTTSPTFSVGFAGVDFGFLAQVGQIDLRQVSDQNAAVQYALNYRSPNGEGEPSWRAEQRKWSSGMENGGISFRDRADAIVGMTYVVRSVNEGGYDIAVLFQVVRRDPTDGSLILAWKILKEFDKPILSR